MPLLDHKQHHFVYRQTGLLATQTLANCLNKSCHSGLQSVELTWRDRNMTKGQSKTYQLLQKSHLGGVWKVIEKPHKGDTISNNTLPRLLSNIQSKEIYDQVRVDPRESQMQAYFTSFQVCISKSLPTYTGLITWGWVWPSGGSINKNENYTWYDMVW